MINLKIELQQVSYSYMCIYCIYVALYKLGMIVCCHNIMMMSCNWLESTRVTINFYHSRHNFLKVPNIFLSQNCWIPAFNSPKFEGLYVDLRYCLREPHMFSIGFKSGDSGGVFHHVMLFLSKIFSIYLL